MTEMRVLAPPGTMGLPSDVFIPFLCLSLTSFPKALWILLQLHPSHSNFMFRSHLFENNSKPANPTENLLCYPLGIPFATKCQGKYIYPFFFLTTSFNLTIWHLPPNCACKDHV